MSRVEFSGKIKSYLKAAGYSQKSLANALDWNSTSLTHKLNGTGRTIFTQPEIRACILALVKLEAVSRQSEVLDLLKTANCPNFKPDEWKIRPLSQLTSDLPNSTLWAAGLKAPALLLDSDIVNHNLPRPISSFIGRKQDLIKLRNMLVVEKHRLITLIGVGGIGKTRLSINLGSDLIDNFTDGVWLVELAPVTNPTLIPQAISEVLGLLEQPGQSVLENLARYLHQRHLLIILDNCEHLIEECSHLTKHLLTHSTRLQVLATSRENLNITGEVIYPVPYLSLPAAEGIGGDTPGKKIDEYEAIKLFVERARAINPAFTFGPEDESSLSRICHRLDGIPLALELAAARTNILSLNQIQARLSDRFQLFTGGSRTELSRHQTLKGLIDWSYNLLSEEEKRLLNRASVFVGSWDLEAAEQICGSEVGGQEKYEVLDCLTRLVNKSLVLIDKPLDGSAFRYHMLETIRQYGLEQLREVSGAEQEIRLRHFYFYTDLVKEKGPDLYEGELLILLKLFDREMDNIRAALDYGLKGEGREADQIMNLFKGLSPYWEVRGLYSEGRYYLEQALALKEAKDKKNEVALGYIYSWAGSFSIRQGDNDAMITYLNRGMAISEAHQEDELLYLLCFNSLGTISLVQGDFAEARLQAEKVVTWTQGKSNVYQALAMTNLGILLLTLGETDESGVWLEKALPLIRNEKNLHVLVLTLLNLGGFEIIREDYPSAQLHLEKAVSTSELIGYPLGVSAALGILGVIYSFQTKFKESQRALVKSLNFYLKSTGKIDSWPGFEGMVAFLAGLWSESRQPGLLEPLAYFCGVNAKILAAGDWEIRTRLFNQGVEIAKEHLPEEEFNSAFARGERLSQEETIAYIRQALSQF